MKRMMIGCLSVAMACHAAEFTPVVKSISPAYAWPEPTREMKPWAYNWWMASAVDAAGLEYQCAEMAKAGFGGMHIIPIYGAKGYEKRYRPYLSEDWMKAYRMAVDTAHRHGLGVDLTMGSGWCFGGPWLTPEQGGWKLVEDGKGGLVPALTKQLVKRAGPGGEGPMMNPYSPAVMDAFLAPFTKAFDAPGVPKPEHFYHDSWEYFKAGWDPEGFFAAFRRKRGYDLREHWKTFCGQGDPEEVARVKCDYRETLSDLVIEDVFPKWFDWCRARGIGTRNEAHGAPANLLDFYALADIPETEMFGKNDREILVSKFASSAAHVTGKRHVAAESCTWIDDHFCERPAEIKSFLDRLFLAGVNRVFYHGLCYSPVEAVWPGWCFYAALEMNPRNPIWRDVLALNTYVTRCQSLFQTAAPDEDVLLYWPIRDLWWNPKGLEIQCTVHHREWLLDQPLGTVARALQTGGYAFDYVSDRQLARLAKPGRYTTIVVPPCRHMPDATAKRLEELAAQGYAVVRLADGEEVCAALARTPARRERLGADLLFTRFRRNGRPLYFLVNTGTVTRRVAYAGTALDPVLGGTSTTGTVALAPEQSVFVAGSLTGVGDAEPVAPCAQARTIAGPWQVTALAGGPTLPPSFSCATTAVWSVDHPFFSGTMCYRTTFTAKAEEMVLDLGTVHETARVRLNGFELGVRFMPPYRFAVPAARLKDGANELEIEVTSLGSNRLRWNDLTGVKWKYFRDTNMVTPAYRPLDAAKRAVVPSGLAGPVTWAAFAK